MPYSIIIIGGGQLGSRYLQGLVKFLSPLNIFVIDPSEKSIELCNERWVEVGGRQSIHQLQLLNSLTTLPKEIDIAIIATSSDVRIDLSYKLTLSSKVRFWIFEKVLAISLLDLNRILEITKKSEFAWVNTPRRMMLWHQKLVKLIVPQAPNKIYISGGNWGLACNSIHFIDFANLIFNESIASVNTDDLDRHWFESKREGFFEVNGRLVVEFKNNKILIMECFKSNEPIKIIIETSKGCWGINENTGHATDPNGKHFYGILELQSDMTSRLVESILHKGICDLPSLANSVDLHSPYLEALLKHWNHVNNSEDNLLRIT
jgi:hypothetical protein